MKPISLFALLAILLLCFSLTDAVAQDTTKAGSTKQHVVIKNDGTEFIGVILADDPREVLIETKKTGKVYIPKHEIKEIKELKPGDINMTGEYVADETFSTRYFISANGLPVKKGENYILWNLFGPDFQFGIGENIGVGVMTTWLGAPVIGTAKYSIRLAEKTHMGVGALLGTGSWASWDMGIALPYASLTYGDRKKNITLSAGYGAIFQNGDAEGRVLCSGAGMIKVGKKISLVFDSFIMPPGGYRDETQVIYNYSTNTYTTTTVKVRRPGFALLIPGARWQMEENKAFQFGFCGLVNDGDLVPFPIPMVQWFRKI
jgi:hypothetical protein